MWNQIILILCGGVGGYMISTEENFFEQFPLHTKKTTHNRVTAKTLKNKKMSAILKSPSDICWENFVNILHFLPLRTKMALSQPILKIDLQFFLQIKIESKL